MLGEGFFSNENVASVSDVFFCYIQQSSCPLITFYILLVFLSVIVLYIVTHKKKCNYVMIFPLLLLLHIVDAQEL